MAIALQVNLSDAMVRRYAADATVRELKDTRRPVRVRYHQSREKASWYVIARQAGKPRWIKVGHWPLVTASAVLDRVPDILARAAIDPSARPTLDTLANLADLLGWFRDRHGNDRNLSAKRRATVRSIIDQHLLPLMGCYGQADLTRARLDRLLFQPLQADYSVAYIRQIYGVLRQATRKAFDLRMIEADPLAGVVFSTFIGTPIKPKGGQLHADQVPELLRDWAQLYEESPADVALAVMMLAHGARVGETRQARWSHIQRLSRAWFIPAEHTKTGVAHRLPLTDQVLAFLDHYQALQKRKGYSGNLMFPARRGGKPLGERRAVEAFARLAGGNWTSHDLRKLARTHWADLGVDYLTGEMLLNHALKNLDATYIHTHAETLKRAALERWHAWLDEYGFTTLQRETGGRSVVGANPANPRAIADVAGFSRVNH